MKNVYFSGLNELELKGIFTMSEEDKEVVLNYLYKGIPLYYNNDNLEVYTDTGLYVVTLFKY